MSLSKLYNYFKKLFSGKRMRTLGDVDSFLLSDADKIGLLPNQSSTPSIDAMLNESRTRLCKKCNKGKLKKVQPHIIMDDKFLYQCKNCGERCYK